MSKQTLIKDNEFTNRTVLVTGAAGGIGLSIAHSFAQNGASVVLADIDIKGATTAAEKIGGNAQAINLDVTSEQDWHSALQKIDTDYGRLDILVNNAGIGASVDFEEMSLDNWNDTFSINTTSVFLGCKICLPLLKKTENASIINIASIYAGRSNPDAMHYSASKSAVISLSKGVALLCANKKYGIRCNAIQPGIIQTPMLEASLAKASDPDSLLQQFEHQHPMGHLGETNDVAQAALFLASEKAKFITGASLAVDGGFLSA